MWLTTKEALKVYGVSLDTLRRYDKDGKITTFRTVGNQRRYWNVYEKDETENDWELQEATMSKQNIKPDRLRQTILYARVSTNNQKSSLDNQIEELKRYAESRNITEYKIVRDIASGIDFKRKGLKWLLDAAETSSIKCIVVTHKDRLARFAFDLLETVFEKRQVELTVLCEENTERGSDTELAEDLLSIIHVFSARANGRKRYNKQFGITKNLQDDKNKSNTSKENFKNSEDVVCTLED